MKIARSLAALTTLGLMTVAASCSDDPKAGTSSNAPLTGTAAVDAPSGATTPPAAGAGADTTVNRPSGTGTLDAAGFKSLVDTAGVVVLDVRTPAEFAAGHLAGAMNIDVEAADFATKVAPLDRATTYAIYCRSGRRSEIAMTMMATAGFTSLRHLDGGIGAWEGAGYPITK